MEETNNESISKHPSSEIIVPFEHTTTFRHSDEKRPLMLFSGGLDSTHLLHDLTQDGKMVDVVHAYLRNNIYKNICEERAIDKIIEFKQQEWEKPKTPRHETSLIGNLFNVDVGTTSQKHGYSQMIRWLTAVFNCVDYKIHNAVVIGYVAGDQATSTIADLKNAWFYLWDSVMQGLPQVPINFSLAYRDKQYILRNTPEELVKLTWSCECPVAINVDEYEPCGNCPACTRSRIERHMYKLEKRLTRIKEFKANKEECEKAEVIDEQDKPQSDGMKELSKAVASYVATTNEQELDDFRKGIIRNEQSDATA